MQGSPTVATEKRGTFWGGLLFLPGCAPACAARVDRNALRLRFAGRAGTGLTVADGGAFDYGNQVTPGYSRKSHRFFPTIV